MNKNFAQRLQATMDNLKISQTELSERTGISKASICEYLSGAYEPKQRNTYKLATALNVKPSYLMGVDEDAPATTPEPPQKTFSQEGWLTLPVAGNIAAGAYLNSPSFPDAEIIEIPPSIAQGHTPEDFFAVEARGQSMEPKILDGDRLVFLRCSELQGSRRVHAISVSGPDGEDCYTAKLVKQQGDILTISAYNTSEWEPRIYTPERAREENLKIHGYLVYLYRDDF